MVVSALAKARQDSTKFGLEADWGSILDEGDPPARGPTGKETPSYKPAFSPTLGTQPPPPVLPSPFSTATQPLLHQPSVGYFAAPSVGNVAAPNEMQHSGAHLPSHVQMQAMFPQLAGHGFFPSPSFHQPLPAIIPSPNTGFVGFGDVPYAAASFTPNSVSSDAEVAAAAKAAAAPSNALDAATDLDAQVKDALDCDEGAAAAFEPPMPPRTGGRVSSRVTPTQAGKKRSLCIPSNGAPGRGRAPSDPTPNKKAAAVPSKKAAAAAPSNALDAATDLDAQVKELQRQANEAKSMKAAAAKERKRAAAEKACEMEDEEIDGAAPKPANLSPEPPAAHKPSAARKGKAAAVPKSKAAPEPPTKPPTKKPPTEPPAKPSEHLSAMVICADCFMFTNEKVPVDTAHNQKGGLFCNDVEACRARCISTRKRRRA